MVLFDSKYLKIEFKNVPCRHLVANWTGSPGEDVYKHGYTTILQCCHENDIRKLLSDIRLEERLSETAEAFAEHQLANYTARHGRFFHAVVLSSEVFLKLRVVNFDRSLGRKNHVQQFFANQQDAIEWLQEADV
ncbi:MAG TPA: hypothetical protein VGD65_18040 [Chryseosolibacter sp.]